jgi:hypothetical protein
MRAWAATEKGYQANPDQLPDSRPWKYLDGTYTRRPLADTGNPNELNTIGLQCEIDPALERLEARFEIDSPVPQFTMALFKTPYGSVQFGGRGHLGAGQRTDMVALQATVSGNWGGLGSIDESGHFMWKQFPEDDGPAPPRQLPGGRPPSPPARHRAVRLFADFHAGTCDLLLDGVHVSHVRAGPESRPVHGVLRIVPSTARGAMASFSNLWVGRWNGALPESGRRPAAGIVLVNGDQISGAPKGLRGDHFEIENDLGAFEIPVNKTAVIEFGAAAPANAAAARLRLVDGTTLNVDAFHYGERELTAHSETWGDLHISRDAIAELVYAPAVPHPPLDADPEKEDKEAVRPK